MKLLEHEGKALLAKHNVPIPKGELWPRLPETGAAGWMVKAQVLAGGRGKRGGIKAAADRGEVERIAAAWQGIDFDGEPVHAAYVEERLEIAKEYYLAGLINRDQGRVNLIASEQGGVDIEQVPAAKIVAVTIDPLIGLADFQIQYLKRALAIGSDLERQFIGICRNVTETLVSEDAELVEINPLVLTKSGQLIAADAKVVLDDDAMSRHPARSSPTAWTSDSAFMQRCREFDVIGVDNRRNVPAGTASVALLGNGAGLTMATYDQVHLSGASVAGAIELHGALARGVAHTANVISALFMLDADAYFINAFYQLRSTDALAQALVEALERPGAPSSDRVVARLRGVQEASAMNIVLAAGCGYSSSLHEATERALEIARASKQRGGRER